MTHRTIVISFLHGDYLTFWFMFMYSVANVVDDPFVNSTVKSKSYYVSNLACIQQYLVNIYCTIKKLSQRDGNIDNSP